MLKFPVWQPKIESSIHTSLLPIINNDCRGNYFLEISNSKEKILHRGNYYFFEVGQNNFSHITNHLPFGVYTITLINQNSGIRNSIRYMNI